VQKQSGTANSSSAGATKMSGSIIERHGDNSSPALLNHELQTHIGGELIWGVCRTPNAPGEDTQLGNDSLSLAAGFELDRLCSL